MFEVSTWTTLLGDAAAIVALAGFGWGVLRKAHRAGAEIVAEGISEGLREEIRQTITSELRPVKDDLHRTVNEELRPVKAELTHNGGASVKDQVTALFRELRDHKLTTASGFADVQRHLERQDDRIDGLYTRWPHPD